VARPVENPAAPRARTTKARSGRRVGRRRQGALTGWLFAAPAIAFYAVFVLRPLLSTFQYSVYRWDGIGPSTYVGLHNYVALFTNSTLFGSMLNAIKLIVFFSAVPVILGLLIASTIRRIAGSRSATIARVVIFFPQIIPLVAAGIIWSWLLSSNGLINQLLKAVGLGGVTRAWLGDFTYALPAVGVIGAWVLLGLCTLLLLAGMTKIDPAVYEAARLDGAGSAREFFSVTLPALRQEIGVCVTVTVIAALASFDIIYISTQGGPGTSTMVPGYAVYYLAFFQREVGQASALAVALMILVLLFVLPIQWLTREKD
jgi:raffinose/stachyose/melibiose transport system permease protein